MNANEDSPPRMTWNEVTRIDVRGGVIVAKDAMVMLSSDENDPEWPSVTCEPGEYVLEIYVPVPFNAHRVRIRKSESDPARGRELGKIDVDHAFVGFIDYEPFLAAVEQDFDSYEEWTMTELDDELAINFSGEISFCGEKLLYVKSVDGDGVYPAFELVEGGQPVGLECILVGE
ncbi:MAG: hypothetical protein QNJ07_03180 [Woeseiaceae bacterium]|nr:hypothetical protein [Woeseiaceae bacterium]